MRLFVLRGATGAQGALIIVAARQMSATQKVQQHPAFIQAQDKANYYVNQLDKEVRSWPLFPSLPASSISRQ